VWTKCLLEGDAAQNSTPLTFSSSQGNDLVTDGHGLHAENMDDQTEQEYGHRSSGMEPNGPVEVESNSASAAIAAAIAAAVDGSEPSIEPPNAVTTSSDAVTAKPTEEATASDGDVRPAESETLTPENDIVPSATAPDPAILSEEQSTNGYHDVQVPYLPVAGKPLQAAASFASTIPDDDAEAAETQIFDEDSGPGLTMPDYSLDQTLVEDKEAGAGTLEQEHLPEPPASPISNTLLSTSSGSTVGESGSQNTSILSTSVSPMKVGGKAVKTPSANRLSISYAAGTRRLVIDAGVVKKLKVFRAEGRIDVIVDIEKDGENGLKGILVCYFHPFQLFMD
jgi:20S proteasome subunit alpha 6